ncbi:MAG: arginine--tRNA ligase [Pseudomonadales bacterium]|nr:arginine--tRNA ligase [Pseudomonadales bacterium]
MKITNVLIKSITTAIQILGLNEFVEKDIKLEHPADKSFGDYSTNIAMVLFGKLKNKPEFNFASPRDLAQAIVNLLNEGDSRGNSRRDSNGSISDFSEDISKIEVAGPGFVNFTLSDSFLLAKMGSIVEKSGDVIEKNLDGKKVMVEFTDPNPFKELHIGHLYSNIVGEAIAKSYEAQGAEVKRVCYQGDVGMHVSKSIWGMKFLISREFPEKKLEQALSELDKLLIHERVSFLGKSYATGASKYEDDENIKKEIQNINFLVFICAQENLESTTDFEIRVDYKKFIPNFSQDSQEYQEIKQLYVFGRNWSLEYFDLMYSRIGMNFDEYFFESLVGEFGYQIVNKFLKQGVFEKSDGAIIFPGSKYGLHDRVFINSLGFPTYEAKELGLAPEKFRRYQYDKSIIITGNEIDEYFKVLLKAMEFTNPDLMKITKHLSHGMVRLPEGKMSSRTGKIITAEWLINEAKDRIKSRMLETRPEFGEEQINTIAEAVGLGAIKFAFLKQSIGKDIAFSFEDSLSFSGNSGPYIQYTYVRCHSVLLKAQNEMSSNLTAEEKSEDNTADSVMENNKELGETDEKVLNHNIDIERVITKPIDILIDNKSYLNYQINNEEKDILRNLYRYSDIVGSVAQEYAPHYLANYLYELAQSFNVFYGLYKIADQRNDKVTTDFRLMLVYSVSLVLRHGLNILGIKTVVKM